MEMQRLRKENGMLKQIIAEQDNMDEIEELKDKIHDVTSAFNTNGPAYSKWAFLTP